MKKYILLLVLTLVVPKITSAGGMIDDPLLTMVMVDQLEVRLANGSDPLVWDAEGWIGKDLNKLWIKTDDEYVDGQADEAELQALYSRAIAPFWDVQLGWRPGHQTDPGTRLAGPGSQGTGPLPWCELDRAVWADR